MDKKLFRFILLIITFTIFLVFALWNIDAIFLFFSKVFKILRPIFFGLIFAFILNKPYKSINRLLKIRSRTPKYDKIFSKLSLIIVYILFFLLITGIILIIVPQFIDSIKMFKENIDNYIANFKSTANDLLNKINAEIPGDFKILDKLSGYFEKVPDIIKTVLLGAFGFTTSIISTVVDIFLGLIISVYFLTGKNRLKMQFKKIILAIFKQEKSEKIFTAIRHTNDTFSNFVSGQLIEACILGTLCFIGMSIIGFEYAFLISVLVGMTNVIPIVGPIIGTIPSFFILLLVNPTHALWFIVYIVVLQQLESNLIYPKVVGTKVGLPALWVLISVILSGGLFGIIGMLFAVPAMSLIYDLTRIKVNESINKNQK